MANIEYQTSSPQVKDFQAQLKKFGYKVPTDGSFDDKTLEAYNDLRGKLGMNGASKEVDNDFLKKMKEAEEPRTKVVIKGKEVWVTKAQLAELKQKAGARAGEAVQKYVSMSEEVKSLWDAHDTTRKANWFWSGAVEICTGADFPSAQVISAAVSAAKSLESKARACALTPSDLDSGVKPIQTAFKAMDTYRKDLFDGGETLITVLETVRDGCVVTLEVTAAIATGGASWEIQVGVSAGLAAYKQTLTEVDTASKTANYSIDQGVVNVFMAAVVDGTVGLMMKGGKLGPFMDEVEKEAIKKAGSSVLKGYIIKAINGGAQKMIEDGIKGLPGLADPKKKFTMKDFVEAAVESFVKGAGLKILGPVCDKYNKGAGKLFSKIDFGKFGKGDLDKAGEAAVSKVIDIVGSAALKKVLDKWDEKKDPKKFEDEVRKEILNDPKVKKAVEDAKKKK
jgi:hypothetical protein